MTHRQCTIELENKCSAYTLCNPSWSIVSGSCAKALPPTLGPSESGSSLFIKTPHRARGSVGVLTYDLQIESTEECDGKMAVMFSVPYDFNLYSNWYAVGLFDENKVCDYSLYEEMYYNTENGFVRGQAKDGGLTYKGEAVTIRATMSDSCTPVINIQAVLSERLGKCSELSYQSKSRYGSAVVGYKYSRIDGGVTSSKVLFQTTAERFNPRWPTKTESLTLISSCHSSFSTLVDLYISL
ncbi:uncharacterized protein LOC122869124 [Siniperca chuatsi]|uniref:uncharacterized protein LOC122869124 n=1 Tax=Siniperca chuatsi TaxID=119488 RepID=UPI001CE18B72|nr:uncharacterized protein LOC122869124 [Siniperca chuatsi]